MISRRTLLSALVAAGLCGWSSARGQTSDPLPSWNDRSAKMSIIDFISRVTTQGGPEFVPVERRIATFDNDGTLWTEHPIYFQVAFAIDQVKAQASKHPEWKQRQPFKAVLRNDTKALAAAGEKGLLQIMAATHAGMTTDVFAKTVADWIATARHPRFNRPYNELVYQPMIELMAHLRANEFKTFIVSGGGIEFMRPWTEKAYGIPPEQVVGSSGVTKFQTGQGWQAGASEGTQGRVHRRRSGQAGRDQPFHRSAAGLRLPAIPTAICRCCNGPRSSQARASR